MKTKAEIKDYFLSKIEHLTYESLYARNSPFLKEKGKTSNRAADNLKDRAAHLIGYCRDIGIKDNSIDDAIKQGQAQFDSYVIEYNKEKLPA